jgi:hypothetical protein
MNILRKGSKEDRESKQEDQKMNFADQALKLPPLMRWSTAKTFFEGKRNTEVPMTETETEPGVMKHDKSAQPSRNICGCSNGTRLYFNCMCFSLNNTY